MDLRKDKFGEGNVWLVSISINFLFFFNFSLACEFFRYTICPIIPIYCYIYKYLPYFNFDILFFYSIYSINNKAKDLLFGMETGGYYRVNSTLIINEDD